MDESSVAVTLWSVVPAVAAVSRLTMLAGWLDGGPRQIGRMALRREGGTEAGRLSTPCNQGRAKEQKSGGIRV
jgi:hypothetical protein